MQNTPEFMRFLSEVKPLALKIAARQRGENHLQSPAILREKFAAECQELAAATDVWDEIPDVTYYAACLCIQADTSAIVKLELEILPKYQISMQQAEAACLAKYRRRAAGYPKDIVAERAVIKVALEEEERWT